MTDHVQVRKAKEKVEMEYDALITKQTRCQGQLSAKAAQAQKLPPGDYAKWLADKKAEMVGIQTEIQVKKAERAEARRLFNSWAPPFKEEWLSWPDDEGWWWFHGKVNSIGEAILAIHEIIIDEEGELIITTDDPAIDSEYADVQWDGMWKYQEAPELP
jgi:hypothetical protein